MSRKPRKPDHIDEALRADPDYQDLVRTLKTMNAKRRRRAEQWLAGEERKGMETKGRAPHEKIAQAYEKHRGERDAWNRVYADLTAEGYQEASAQAVRKRYQRAEKKMAQASHDSQPGEGKSSSAETSQRAQSSHTTETATAEPQDSQHSQTGGLWTAASDDSQGSQGYEHLSSGRDGSQSEIPNEWREGIRRLIREEMKSVIARPANTAMEMPPERPKVPGKRKRAGQMTTMPGTRIDKALMDRFTEERRRLRLSASEMMQALLWNGLGKPSLSFEEEPYGNEQE